MSKRCPVVALGASAGGLEAFQRFFQSMPATPGISFVLLQHVDPSHESLMPSLLGKYTPMPVLKGSGEFSLEPDTVYVLPAGGSIAVERCTVRIGGGTQRNQTPIDDFFRHLAEDQGPNVVGVILSGAGTDGTLGLRAIKQHGGLTIAQAPETAKVDGMPKNAIASGVVDFIAPVELVPRRILDYVEHLAALEQRRGAEGLQREAAGLLPRIFPLLQRVTGHDFSRYKQSTLVRRVQRRVQILQLDSVSEYVGRLRGDEQEIENLFKDLLIGVTQFFRDPESFRVLAERIIAPLCDKETGDRKMRVWVPGCASGEEAYSIAMLFAEHPGGEVAAGNVQIFATDLDVESLEIARKATYPESIAEQLSPERLERFFIKHNGGYEVIGPIREMCVFSPHNLTKDPPFSRLDLISCRNVLIYLEAELQRRLLPVLHYALNPAGFLFLGSADNVASRSELFHVIDQQHRIYQRKPGLLHSPSLPLFDAPSGPRALTPLPSLSAPPREHTTVRTIERVLLEDYAPACVVINDQGEVLYYSGHTSRYLEHQAGTPSNKLLTMARKSLRLELRTAIHRAVSTRKETVRENLRVKVGREVHRINLVVRPLTEMGKTASLFAVVFQELVPASNAPPLPATIADDDHPLVQQLENELRMTKEDLQTTIEEVETSNEELKSANEELLSMNEELQSTNEELQTSKEELQSVNEELQRKVEEADSANTSLQNFLQSSQVATVFVDRSLRLKRFTPAMAGIIPLAQRDLGRNFAQLARDLLDEEALLDLQEVMRTGTPRERQLSAEHGRSWYLMRTMPFRGSDDSMQGAVVTLANVTDLKRHHEERAKLAAIVDGSQDAIIGKTLEGVVTSWNPAAERMYGYSQAEMIGRSISILTPPRLVPEIDALFARIARGEAFHSFETERMRRDGSVLLVSLTLSPIRDGHGRIVGVSGIDRDITAERKADEHRMRLAAIVENSDDAVISKALDGTITSWNEAAERIFGFTAEEMVGSSILMIVPPEKREEEAWIMGQLSSGRKIDHFETVRVRKDGSRIEVSLTNSPIRDRTGRIVGASKIARDITERIRSHRELREAQEQLARHAVELERAVAERTASLKTTVQSLEALCYTIAHDLRAPLRATQGFTQELVHDYGNLFDDDGKELARRIVAATRRMDALIDDLLTYARLSHDELPTSAVDLNVEMERTLENFAPEIASKNAQISVSDLPLVTGNPTVLGQVLGNLLGNALKFVRPGIPPRVDIRAEPGSNGEVRLFFRDSGIGIPVDQHEKIFGLFHRLHSDAYPGTGIGLAIVKQGLQRIGGRIAIDPTWTEGTCFILDLPAPTSPRKQ